VLSVEAGLQPFDDIAMGIDDGKAPFGRWYRGWKGGQPLLCQTRDGCSGKL